MQDDKTPAKTQADLDKGKVVGTGAVEQVVKTGLPPGIRPDEAKDPGKAHEQGPVDNRS
jgi:hypothetical protein